MEINFKLSRTQQKNFFVFEYFNYNYFMLFKASMLTQHIFHSSDKSLGKAISYCRTVQLRR